MHDVYFNKSTDSRNIIEFKKMKKERRKHFCVSQAKLSQSIHKNKKKINK